MELTDEKLDYPDARPLRNVPEIQTPKYITDAIAAGGPKVEAPEPEAFGKPKAAWKRRVVPTG